MKYGLDRWPVESNLMPAEAPRVCVCAGHYRGMSSMHKATQWYDDYSSAPLPPLLLLLVRAAAAASTTTRRLNGGGLRRMVLLLRHGRSSK